MRFGAPRAKRGAEAAPNFQTQCTAPARVSAGHTVQRRSQQAKPNRDLCAGCCVLSFPGLTREPSSFPSILGLDCRIKPGSDKTRFSHTGLLATHQSNRLHTNPLINRYLIHNYISVLAMVSRVKPWRFHTAIPVDFRNSHDAGMPEQSFSSRIIRAFGASSAMARSTASHLMIPSPIAQCRSAYPSASCR